MTDDERRARARMVAEQIEPRDVSDRRVIAAMHRVPRHRFVAEAQRSVAYQDRPLPIGYRQTISQPLMVALMLQALELDGSEHALEVGAGCGYQAALLSLLARDVVTVEIIEPLANMAKRHLQSVGADNVEVCLSDGSLGYPAAAPYDAIIVAAGAPAVPPPLLAQLADGGRLVIPVDAGLGQDLLRLRRRGDAIERESLGACAFVPLVGELGHRRRH